MRLSMGGDVLARYKSGKDAAPQGSVSPARTRFTFWVWDFLDDASVFNLTNLRCFPQSRTTPYSNLFTYQTFQPSAPKYIWYILCFCIYHDTSLYVSTFSDGVRFVVFFVRFVFSDFLTTTKVTRVCFKKKRPCGCSVWFCTFVYIKDMLRYPQNPQRVSLAIWW